MAITTNKRYSKSAKDQGAFFYNTIGEPTQNIEGLVQIANSGGEVIDPASGASSSVGGGASTYSTAQGDFTATITDATKNITVTGLPFTLEAEHVVAGSIKKITSTGVVTIVDTDTVSVAGTVITLAEADDFATGDTVVVSLTGPDKAYDEVVDSNIVTVLNPGYAHYTSVETLISESNLGITGTADGASDANTIEDTSETFTNAIVAIGYLAYSEEEDLTATINSVSATLIETGAGITDWIGDTYWAAECKRFVIPAEGYNYLTIHTRLTTTAIGNSAFCKIYGTLDANAVDTDDTLWVDLSTEIFGAELTCAGASGTQEGIYFVNATTPILKYMIKIVGELNDNGAGAIGAQTFTVYIKKSS